MTASMNSLNGIEAMNNVKNKELKLAIIGHGFVGKAVDWGFDKNVEKFLIDPKLETKIQDLKDFNPDVAFICVPTPMGENGYQDDSIIQSVVKELYVLNKDISVCIKSTVLPNVLDDLKKINKKIVYNPEFLREKFANDDFINANVLIFGGDVNEAKKISKFFEYHSRCKTKEYKFVNTYDW